MCKGSRCEGRALPPRHTRQHPPACAQPARAGGRGPGGCLDHILRHQGGPVRGARAPRCRHVRPRVCAGQQSRSRQPPQTSGHCPCASHQSRCLWEEGNTPRETFPPGHGRAPGAVAARAGPAQPPRPLCAPTLPAAVGAHPRAGTAERDRDPGPRERKAGDSAQGSECLDAETSGNKPSL